MHNTVRPQRPQRVRQSWKVVLTTLVTVHKENTLRNVFLLPISIFEIEEHKDGVSSLLSHRQS